jgi:hypothetical protein
MEQSPLDPKGTIVYESILLQHLLHISTTEACGISIATAVTGVFGFSSSLLSHSLLFNFYSNFF